MGQRVFGTRDLAPADVWYPIFKSVGTPGTMTSNIRIPWEPKLAWVVFSCLCTVFDICRKLGEKECVQLVLRSWYLLVSSDDWMAGREIHYLARSADQAGQPL